MSDDANDDARIRLDIWLWRARFFKSRSLAGAFIDKGRIRLARGPQSFRVSKTHQEITAGDRLTFPRAGHIVDLEVRDVGWRRGPASEARALYELMDAEPSDSGADEG